MKNYKIGVKVAEKQWFCVEVSTREEMTQEKAEYIGIMELKKVNTNAEPLEVKYKLI